MQLDLMRTYTASRAQVFWKLRWPASLPFLFASLKVAIAIALVGAIVGELPTGAQAGHRRAPAHRLLLRPDDPDLGGAVRGRDPVGVPGLAIGVIERLTARLMGARP